MRVNKFLIAAFSVSMLMACKKEGCTDQAATNYDSKAKNDDGSCVYDTNTPGGGGAGGGTTGPNGETLPIRLTGTETDPILIKDMSTNPSVSDYYIDGVWKAGADVTIEPGVNIEMRAGAYIVVESNGSMNATGTPSNKIQILGAEDEKGFWNYIRYESNDTKNKLIHCNVSHGSGTWQAEGMISVISNASLTVQNSTITKGDQYGLFVSNPDGKLPNFKSNHFDNFNKNPISLWTFEQSGTLDNTTTFGANNLVDEIRVHGDSYSNSVSVPKLNLPYYLATDFNINGGDTGFMSGIDLIMGPNTTINVNNLGSLSFDGTASDRINVYGASGIKGYWESIVLTTNSTDNSFSYTNFNYGGGTWNNEATLYMRGGALAMDNCDIKNGDMMAVGDDGNGTFIDNGGNTWSDCDDGGGLLP
mgnify:CR=1 FL=1